MKEQKYRIIFKGEIIPNASLDEVKQKLAAFYKVNFNEIDSLFTGKKFVLKENVDLDAAQKFMYQLEEIGALCQLVKIEESRTDSTVTAPEPTPQPTAAKKEEEKEEPEEVQNELYYRLFFKGEILHGKDINEVKTNLSMFYKVKPDKLSGLFTGKPVAITQEPTDFWTAVSYLNRFKECGAVCYLETVESPGKIAETSENYKIIFWGKLQAGYDMLSVKTNLASMFKVSGIVVDKLFLEKPVLIRTNLTQEAAKLFKVNMEKTGARCQILAISEKPQPPAPYTSEPEVQAALAPQSPPPAPKAAQEKVDSPPPPAVEKQFTYHLPQQPPQSPKKSSLSALLLFVVGIFVLLIIFKAISRKSTIDTEPTSPKQTITTNNPSRTSPSRPSNRQPQQTPQVPSGSKLQKEPAKTFNDPNKYYSISLPAGYIIINESIENRSKILFNYSANINVTITANSLTENWNPQEAMDSRVTEIEDGRAGALSSLDITNYDLVNFSGLSGYEIYLERGTQSVHLYELVSPTNTIFSIIIVTVGDNNQENHDILNSAIRESLKY